MSSSRRTCCDHSLRFGARRSMSEDDDFVGPAPGDPGRDDSPNGGRPPTWIFPLEIAYIACLVTLAVAYNHSAQLRHWVPDPAGGIPLSVAWWGAVGGVTISLTGIFRHPRSWDDGYNKWHVARPVLGAIVGSVGYLIFIVV